ncbi:hypothetical protein Q5P01_008224 [Channa striata]|uniref:Uncharacterized protein n=1 Tax=Channa striata TaxID=64152 RepID=A0AA88N857_CHASR|nr:hypothetical protein Q5P01_008224 [Channa striata]
MLSLFGSTYLCEKTFSVLNLNKSRVRTRLTDSHLPDTLGINAAAFEPDLAFVLSIPQNLYEPRVCRVELTPAHCMQSEKCILNSVDKKTVYMNCVKIINKTRLCNRSQSFWSERQSRDNELSPQWRILHKPALQNCADNLQWQIFHGAISTNAFLSVMNPAVLNKCPYYVVQETVFHVFPECRRLTVLFDLLTHIFACLTNVSLPVFIFVPQYTKDSKEKCQLLNFLMGEEKMSIYLSLRDRMQGGPGQDEFDSF